MFCQHEMSTSGKELKLDSKDINSVNIYKQWLLLDIQVTC